MSTYIADRLDIADLMTGWMYRDLGDWDRLRTLFHPDGVIEVTWFEGKFSDFVDASMRMGASDIRTKHLITPPVVTIAGDRAIAETNSVVVGENIALKLGCNAHTRFYDLVEKRDGVWKIAKRHCIYDMATFTFPHGIVDIDTATVAKYPREYAPLAYLLDRSGFPVKRIFPTRGGDQEKTIRAFATKWLSEKT